MYHDIFEATFCWVRGRLHPRQSKGMLTLNLYVLYYYRKIREEIAITKAVASWNLLYTESASRTGVFQVHWFRVADLNRCTIPPLKSVKLKNAWLECASCGLDPMHNHGVGKFCACRRYVAAEESMTINEHWYLMGTYYISKNKHVTNYTRVTRVHKCC